jgi:hypothetical protein
MSPEAELARVALATRLAETSAVQETIDAAHCQQAIGALLEKQLVNENAFLKEIAAVGIW